MRRFFPKSFRSFRWNINLKVDLSNYATKVDIKNILDIDSSSFALKKNLANLKTEVDKLDIDKLVLVPTDLSKLTNAVKNDVVKKGVYDKLVAKGNAILLNSIDTIHFVLKTKYNTESELENQTRDTSGLVKKTDYITKISEIEDKTPDISNLGTKTALRAVENKILDVGTLV